ncbi:MAG: tetratricopeptide repeat protein, partial [Bernardetiaceae bacterium]
MKHLFLIGLLFLAITGQAQEQQAKEYFEAGEKHRKARRYKEAIVAYETAASYNPTMSDAYVQKGRCQFILKEYEGAAETFEQIIEISPQTFEAYNSLWKIYGIQEKPEQMIQTYERAAEAATKPELKQLYLLKIADFLDKSDRTTDMLPYLEQAKEINSDAPELQYLWGKYHVNQEQYKEALPYLEGAYAQTKAKPIKESGQYLYLLGYTYAQLDRYLDALPILKKITEGPYQPMAYRLLPEYHYYVGAAYHDLYQPEAAKAALERALRIDP